MSILIPKYKTWSARIKCAQLKKGDAERMLKALIGPCRYQAAMLYDSLRKIEYMIKLSAIKRKGKR
jgi:hypothetical protein